MLAHVFFELVQDTVPLALVAGVIAGVAHVFMGPDHLAALLPVSVNGRLKAAWLGFRWGIGHTIGVVIVAILLMAARSLVDDAEGWTGAFEFWGEIAVGVFLVALGVWGVWQGMRQKLHVHTHSHGDGVTHAHLHVHEGDEEGWQAHVHKHAALGAGTFHGMAGMAHLLVIAPVVAAPDRLMAFTYLGGYAVGSVAAMMLFAGMFGVVTSKLGERGPKIVRLLVLGASGLCLLIGAVWIIIAATGAEVGHHHD